MTQGLRRLALGLALGVPPRGTQQACFGLVTSMQAPWHSRCIRLPPTGMDASSRKEADARLRRIAGQLAGIQRMLAEDRYCIDVLIQIASVQAALTQTSKVLLAGHLETCVAQALTSGSKREREQKIAEVVDMFARFYGTPALRPDRGRGPR